MPAYETNPRELVCLYTELLNVLFHMAVFNIGMKDCVISTALLSR